MKHDDTDYHKKKRPRTKMPMVITDNIPEGYELHVSGKLIFEFFREELIEKFMKYPDPDDNKEDPEHSNSKPK